MRFYLSLILSIFFSFNGLAQEHVEILSTSQFRSHERLFLAPLESWIFKKGDIEGGEKLEIDASDWQVFNPTQLTKELEDQNGRVEGWFRLKIRLDDSFDGIPLAISRDLWAATDVYINGELIHSFGDTGNPYQAFNPLLKYPIPIELVPRKEYLLAVHFVDYESTFTQREIRLKPQNLQPFLNLTGPDYITWVDRDYKHTHIYVTLCLGVSFLLFFLYWFLVYLNPDQSLFHKSFGIVQKLYWQHFF